MAAPGNRFCVDLDLLDEAIGAIGTFTAEAETWIDEVDAHINDLYGSWSGDAASAQHSAHDRWVAGARRMHADLEKLRADAARAHGNYSDAVNTNIRMWPE